MSRTVNPEAHRLVLKGRYFWNRRTTEGFAQAEQAFGARLKWIRNLPKPMPDWPTCW